ncbi:uncharacterized protein [Pituophis catenifer annectens]|uniref:uncharacterized protein n=1 Tax=Pituophis catenifer annectens TaxID=94852 RepID=UPI003992BCFD
MVSPNFKRMLSSFLLHTAWKMGSGQLHYSVLEESQHGTFVGRITQDLGLEVSELVPRMFRMLSKGEKDYFEVNLQNGILFVNSRIDREELCTKNADCVLHLEVIVEKPLVFFHVEVEVKDINDNPPIFSAREQILSMAELIKTGTRFPLEGASDADIGTNTLLTYKLSPSNHFILDSENDEDESKSVVLLLKVPLDREESPVHRLVLTATDGGEPKLTGTVQLVIKVLDVNDNPPVFNQSAYKVKLLENTASESLVIALNAADLDEGINKEISYFFSNKAPPHVTKLFSINSDIGEIRMIGKLDYEESKFYELPIIAEDKGSPQLSGHCKVLIEVLDMNDNVPKLSVNSLSVPLPENSPPGTVVAIISASDKDSGINGQINCFLWPTGVPFKLESTFKNYYSLIVGADLDREQVAEYRMVVTVEDQGVPPLSSSLTILVSISDINDNAPAFTQPSYTVFVKENNPPGAHIFTMSAGDPDIAENALITYWIDEKLWPLSSYISVHSESGKLYALQSLDYEELKLLEFHVRAKDAGMPSLCGNATVQVFVMDENDNAPALSRSSEENLILLVVPMMPGHIVGKVHALDADSGYNAWLKYELVEESNSPWSVGQYSGEVSTKYSLEESEGSKIHSVLVLVKDHGKPQLSATATLSVSLVTNGQTMKTDINLQRSGENFVPLVDSINVYLIIAICSVSSLFLLATLIYMALRCHCKEKEPMVYGPGMATLVCASEVGSWSYSNRHSHILAGVSAEAGVKSDLMIFSPNIPVFADNGELINGVDVPPDSAKKGLLQLLLLHTAWKMGSGQLHYSVLEESQHGTFVGRIAQDLGLEVSELVPRMFRMLSKGEKDYFEVNLQNGILFVNSQIDREELCAKNADCVLHLEVIVEKPLRFFHVEVEVKDINDNAPIFSAREQILSMAEFITASGTRFPLKGASDADIATNALLNYKLSPNNHFILDTGNDEDESKSVVLLLKVPLDREESPVHHLVLTATDGGEPKLTGTVQLVIKVLDVNDNPPVFNQSIYRVKLLENTVSGSLVINLNATDLDEGINREISYFFTDSLAPHVTKSFSINSDTGEIIVIGKLDYEESKFYELPIVAEDNGSSQLSGHCKVLIEVLDMNDNVPELSVNSLSVPLPENSPPGTVVAIISASDKDSGINGQINCFLWPTGVPFKLESTFKNYYSLIVGADLDREQVAEYRMVVTVEDQGVPPLSSSLTILVSISDINDNAPAFTQPSYTVFVKENNPPGAHIFTMSAGDPDIAENALITYWIDEKLWPLSGYISVHSESGKLYALQSLDYEELKLLEFHVRAKDAGMPSLCGNATVQVFVMDENDNAPALSRSSEENLILLVVPMMPGHIVGKVHALDADSGYNAWLKYELVEESNSPWSVGQYSGEVSTKYSLEESEGSKIHSVLVLVKDHGKPQLSATATLSVSLVTNGQTMKTDINLQRSGENFVPLVDSINVYLIIAICSVSSLFLLATLIYMALRCHCKEKEPMVYGPGMATLVCASEVGSWSYSNRHSHILAGVSAEAGVKSDLMIFSPNIPVFADNGELINGVDVSPDSAKKVSPALRVLVIHLASYFHAYKEPP